MRRRENLRSSLYVLSIYYEADGRKVAAYDEDRQMEEELKFSKDSGSS